MGQTLGQARPRPTCPKRQTWGLPSQRVHQQTGPPPTPLSLGEQDQVLLKLLASGPENPEIAAHLHVSEKTVRNRLTQTFARLRVHNRTQAAVYALRAGIAHL